MILSVLSLIYLLFLRNQGKQKHKQMNSKCSTARQSSEYFCKDRMFCTTLKGFDLASFSWFLLVQRTSLMSNDLGMVSASWHGHKPSWHGDSELIILLLELGGLRRLGNRLTSWLLFTMVGKQWHNRNKTNCMSKILCHTMNSICY